MSQHISMIGHQQELLYGNDYKVVHKINYLEYVFTGRSLLFEIAGVVSRDVVSTDMIWYDMIMNLKMSCHIPIRQDPTCV